MNIVLRVDGRGSHRVRFGDGLLVDGLAIEGGFNRVQSQRPLPDADGADR